VENDGHSRLLPIDAGPASHDAVLVVDYAGAIFVWASEKPFFP
jgi:hypothetical protein